MNYMKQKTLPRIIKCPLSQSFVALSTCPSTFSVSFEDILVKKKGKQGKRCILSLLSNFHNLISEE